MTETQNTKPYNLEERTLQFTRNVISFINSTPKTTGNFEVGRQVIRAAGSIGASYIEAADSFGKTDFLMRIRICRKGSKESRYWLNLVDIGDDPAKRMKLELLDEADQLTKIFGAILQKAKPEKESVPKT
ncbi:MAG TPA: four helix bundle protein [Dehalococcoidales bacterium]|nr:four helix bundle protein [Dehalococcoidales bacterium]